MLKSPILLCDQLWLGLSTLELVGLSPLRQIWLGLRCRPFSYKPIWFKGFLGFLCWPSSHVLSIYIQPWLGFSYVYLRALHPILYSLQELDKWEEDLKLPSSTVNHLQLIFMLLQIYSFMKLEGNIQISNFLCIDFYFFHPCILYSVRVIVLQFYGGFNFIEFP